MRLYLRTFRVGVADEELIGRLVHREAIPLGIITDLRKAVAQALRLGAIGPHRESAAKRSR
jgi:hypothetical protein